NRLQPSPMDVATFYLNQHDITQAIEHIVYAHIHTPFPGKIKLVGEDYVLNGIRKDWAYGQRLTLTWGGQVIQPCSHKWIFEFEAITGPRIT
ncbi:hypothetical protein AMATHDRAFT_144724, partial [Amanita thiersii Skay4041]